MDAINSNIPKSYVVQSGDKLRDIYMKKFNLSADQATAKIREDIAAGKQPDHIVPGQIIENPLAQVDVYTASAPSTPVKEETSFLDFAKNIGKSIGGFITSGLSSFFATTATAAGANEVSDQINGNIKTLQEGVEQAAFKTVAKAATVMNETLAIVENRGAIIDQLVEKTGMSHEDASQLIDEKVTINKEYCKTLCGRAINLAELADKLNQLNVVISVIDASEEDRGSVIDGIMTREKALVGGMSAEDLAKPENIKLLAELNGGLKEIAGTNQALLSMIDNNNTEIAQIVSDEASNNEETALKFVQNMDSLSITVISCDLCKTILENIVKRMELDKIADAKLDQSLAEKKAEQKEFDEKQYLSKIQIKRAIKKITITILAKMKAIAKIKLALKPNMIKNELNGVSDLTKGKKAVELGKLQDEIRKQKAKLINPEK